MQEQTSQPTLAAELAHLRRWQRRAIALGVLACTVSLSVALAFLLTARTGKPVIATNGESAVEISSAFVDIAQRVEPAVVNISTVTQPVRGSLRDFYQEERPRMQQFGGQTRVQRGNGSGFVIDPQGYILTNRHVIESADRIVVKFFDGNTLPGRVVGSDSETDLAVVKVEPLTPLPAARIGSSERTRVGDWVLAIGSPFNLSQTVTAGIISAKDREAAEMSQRGSRGFQYFLQTDAAINPGNSGGPLINLSGEVIGINTAIASTTGEYNGIGFALPMHEAINIYQQLVKHGRVVRGFLGAMTEPVTPQIAKVYGLAGGARGALISNLNETVTVNGQTVISPAAKAGLRLNDIILEYRGERIRDDKDLIRRIGSTPVNTVAPMRIFRDGRELTLNVTIGKRPGADLAAEETLPTPAATAAETPRAQSIGIEFNVLRGQLGVRRIVSEVEGVYVAGVTPGSVADDAGLRTGDVVEAINRVTVQSKEECQRSLNRTLSGSPLVLQVYRAGLEPNPRIFISFTKP